MGISLRPRGLAGRRPGSNPMGARPPWLVAQALEASGFRRVRWSASWWGWIGCPPKRNQGCIERRALSGGLGDQSRQTVIIKCCGPARSSRGCRQNFLPPRLHRPRANNPIRVHLESGSEVSRRSRRPVTGRDCRDASRHDTGVHRRTPGCASRRIASHLTATTSPRR